MMEVLETVCRRFKIPLNVPWSDLDPKERRLILYGLPKDETVRMRYVSHSGHSRSFEAGYEGVINNLQRRYRETESEWVKQEIERLMMQKPCPACNGARLKPEYLAVTIDGMNIAEFCKHSISSALRRLDSLRLSEREQTIARQVIKEIKERLGFLHDVGLDYITIDRGAATLSGGEAQRIRLATQIGSKLMGVLYILDEPSIGLHQRDNHKLIRTLLALRDIGNTLIVVEHDEETIRAADWVVDIGPGAGEHGGLVMASGTVEDVLATPESITGQYLRGERSIPLPLDPPSRVARRTWWCAARAPTTCATSTRRSRSGRSSASPGSAAAARARSSTTSCIGSSRSRCTAPSTVRARTTASRASRSSTR